MLDSLSPSDPPVPISSTWSAGSGSGSITFDRPLDQTQVPDLATVFRGQAGLASRQATFLNFATPDTIGVVVEAFGSGPILPTGWAYAPPPGWIQSDADGAPAVAFQGVT